MTRSALIIGGSGQIGRAVAARLLDEGWAVTAAHRGAKAMPADLLARGVNELKFDRGEEGALARAIGPGFDAVIDAVAYDEKHAAQLLGVQNDVGAFVVISSLSVFCDEQGRSLDEARKTGFPDFSAPLTEDHITVRPGPETYSTRKVALEQALMEGAKTSVTVLRPGAIHGPGSPNPREWWFLKRALDGRRRVPVGWRGAHALVQTYVGNIAALTVAALAAPGARILNVTDPDPRNVCQLGEAIGAAAGHDWEIVPLAGPAIGMVGYTPWSLPAPMAIDISRAYALGYRPVATYGEAFSAYWREMAAALKDRPGKEVLGLRADPFDYAADDKVLADLAAP